MALCNYSIVLLILLTLISSVMASHSSNKPVKGGYFASWSNLTASSINTKLYTHIYYAFLNPNNVTFKFDIDHTQALQLVEFTSTLHAKKQTLKTLFSVGGAGEASVVLTRMASSPMYRKNFIFSTIEVARKFGFDGIDFDWEFPQTPEEMSNLGLLLEEWGMELRKEAKSMCRPTLLLTAAVYYSAELSGPPRHYPVASVGDNLDLINVMNYDYHGAWNTSVTGAQAALYDPKSNISTSYGLESWVQAGFPRSKLIMGLPLYGRTWQLKDPNLHGVGAPAIGVGPGPDGTGVLTFAELVQFNKDHDAKKVHDLVSVSAYSVAGDMWVGYDDMETVTVKIGFARALGLHGYFFWALHGDYKWKISKTGTFILREQSASLYEMLFETLVLLGRWIAYEESSNSDHDSPFDNIRWRIINDAW